MIQQLSIKIDSHHDASLRQPDCEPIGTTCLETQIEDLVHELRQPLSAIETLAYLVEMISPDAYINAQAERIRALILKANHILDDASARQVAVSRPASV